MKLMSLLIGLIIIHSAYAQTDYTYKLENEILHCFYQHHNDHNIDVKSITDKMENILVRHNVLTDTSGKSYIRIIEQIRDNNDFIIEDPTLIAEIGSIHYIPSGVFCYDTAYIEIDSVDYAHSKIRYLIGLFDSVKVKEDISPASVAAEILEVLNHRDFEHPYYKTTALIMFVYLIKINSDFDYGLVRKLPPLNTQDSVKTEKHNLFIILMNEEDKILANGKLITMSEINPLVKKFLLETSDKTEIDLPLIGKQKTSRGIISLQNERGTSYDAYVRVINELTSVYEEIRDEYSHKFFHTSFDRLNEKQKQVITDLVPLNISEAEPTH